MSNYMTGNPKDVVDLRRWLREHRGTGHRPETCGPTLPLLIRGRARHALRLAIHEWRTGSRRQAWYLLGVAAGATAVLWDTPMYAVALQQKIERVRKIFDHYA